MVDAIGAVSGTSAIDFQSDTPPIPKALDDSVSFSIPAQVMLLAQQGASVSQIASEMGVPKEEVMIDLNFITTAVTPTGSSTT